MITSLSGTPESSKLYHEYDADGFLVGWYTAGTPRPNSTEIPFAPIEPWLARFVNGVWVDDRSRVDAAGRAAVVAVLFKGVADGIDAVAKEWGYDDINEAVSYADEVAIPKYSTEGKLLRTWRSLCWSTYEANVVTMNSVDELIAVLPSPPARPI